jgi:uncharacterized protein YbaP (TraB family)
MATLLALAPVRAGAEPAANAIHASPPLWVVRAGTATVYLLGTVHTLPEHVEWRSETIANAAKSADTFVFEVPEGPKEIDEATRFIKERGLLPPGQYLPDLLSPAAAKNYDSACALAGMPARCLSDKRPWLAAVVLTASYLSERHLTDVATPDEVMLNDALRDGKALRYLDTTREQLEFLARFDQTMGLRGFSAMLEDFHNQPMREDALVNAWIKGDTEELARLVARGMEDDPEGMNLLTSHDRRWAGQIEKMIAEGHTYFVVVGIAHLVGANGVPALLRADGYGVEGP